MPCTAKKSEAQDLSDVDYVLTTRELAHLWDRFGIDFAHFTERAPLDAPFAEASGAGRLFAGSGGVMEAALRTAHMLAAGDGARRRPRVAEARGTRGRAPLHASRPATRSLNLAVVNGLGRRRGGRSTACSTADPPLHFVEVMSCPGGCIGGGGQPYGTDADAVRRAAGAPLRSGQALPHPARRTRTPTCRRSTRNCSAARSARSPTACCTAPTPTAAAHAAAPV